MKNNKNQEKISTVLDILFLIQEIQIEVIHRHTSLFGRNPRFEINKN